MYIVRFYLTTSHFQSLKVYNPKGIIFSGGPASIYSEKSPRPDNKIFDAGIPILGICYGHQLIVDHFGGKIKRTNRKEYGRADLIIENKLDLFHSMDDEMIKCWMSHGDAAEVLPTGSSGRSSSVSTVTRRASSSSCSARAAEIEVAQHAAEGALEIRLREDLARSARPPARSC